MLPLSFGNSSLTLLHVLDQHIRTQLERTTRSGYEIHVLYVDQSTGRGKRVTRNQIDLLKQRYPMHTFDTTQLEKVFEYQGCLINADELSSSPFNLITNMHSRLSAPELLRKTLSCLPSRTSQVDMVGILRCRLVIAVAMEKDCECILWGDSTTRLAEKTLAEIAKGRGSSLPWQIGDGWSPHGINFVFPMRDLLRKEIVSFSKITIPSLIDLVFEHETPAQALASFKIITIDDLMGQYFESVEQNFPSIVSNVVRTSSKLKTVFYSGPSKSCEICGLPVVDGTNGFHGWHGNQEQGTEISEIDFLDNTSQPLLCYGCTRSVQNSR